MDADAKELICHLFAVLTVIIEDAHDLAAVGQADVPDPAHYVAQAVAITDALGHAQALAHAADILAKRAARRRD